ncbi:hypothetical protein BU61_7907 [Pontoporia blainvillei]|uniref:Bcl-2 Bcl-2 homology region 1-3 domain-containing protein n=1 Tax=Pontoporia blainvillei TaxID=48723 RepID=A0ABX0S576_PONBL|nr:hypothetical protein [Pontoporia blainvillei]
MGQVGRQLAIIGDDINQRYDSEFQAMLQHLQPTAENAYEYFIKIASSLFESGINWGRVVALLGFGYRLALHVYQRGLTGFLGQGTRFVADFMLHHCIARWIAQRGGWVSAQALTTSSLLLGPPLSQPHPSPQKLNNAASPPMTTLSLLAGGSPGLGKRPHQECADSSGCGFVGPVCGTKIFQVMTPGGVLWGPETPAWTLAQFSPFTSTPAGVPSLRTQKL